MIFGKDTHRTLRLAYFGRDRALRIETVPEAASANLYTHEVRDQVPLHL
jgi:hypothetical protein